MAAAPIAVVAGVLRDAEGRVLVTRRPSGKALAGLWEFPGGKVEPGEHPAAALERELFEELGVHARAGATLISVSHESIVLDVREVVSFEGQPSSREGQALAWIDPECISRARMTPADRPVVAALRLPGHYLITPEPARDQLDAFHANIDRVLASGVRLIQLRLPGWSRADVASVAVHVRGRCAAYGARLLLHADSILAMVLGLDGVHLPWRVAERLATRPLANEHWIGVSCHDADQLAHAAAIGADFATLSPVFPTASHPDAPALGWARASALTAASAIPVYLLGGMAGDDLARSREIGAQGVAAIRALWNR